MEALTTASHAEHLQRLEAVGLAYRELVHDNSLELLSGINDGFSRLASRLRQPTRVAFFGEANVGKTTLANRMLGAQVLPTSVISNTPYLVHISYGQVPGVVGQALDGTRQRFERGIPNDPGHSPITLLEISLPLPQLQDIEILDTPSFERHGKATQNSVLQSDVWVWCTNASRAWSASDRAARLNLPPIPRERAILVATNADTLGGDAAREGVRRRLEIETAALFGRICFSSLESEAHAHQEPGSQRDQDVSFERAVFQTIRNHRERRNRTVGRLARRLGRLSLSALQGSPVFQSMDAAKSAKFLSAIKSCAKTHY